MQRPDILSSSARQLDVSDEYAVVVCHPVTCGRSLSKIERSRVAGSGLAYHDACQVNRAHPFLRECSVLVVYSCCEQWKIPALDASQSDENEVALVNVRYHIPHTTRPPCARVLPGT